MFFDIVLNELMISVITVTEIFYGHVCKMPKEGHFRLAQHGRCCEPADSTK
jgi:hypothetical protein